ncbi:hypothetical protein T4C_4703 [Trichinella pseudospiralis]|uniref:Uncharacterized protein n=1 Tax=Trichinella pseudospiralis TaxID=6337 RepID=A0A0V1J1L4_TRIPS|nr:hypothetical protein T4C_4703 [Trichinella pseudospiralis]
MNTTVKIELLGSGYIGQERSLGICGRQKMKAENCEG